jgi:hypothetical protein
LKKLIIALVISANFIYAQLVDAIALVVNGEPITLYDIDKTMTEKGMTKEQAIGLLLDSTLYEQALEAESISVDFFEMEDYMDRLAASNGMTLAEFKAAIRARQNMVEFEEEIKERIKREKLTRKVASRDIKRASKDDIRRYYENNIDKFNIAGRIEVIVYKSKSRGSIKDVTNNPIITPEDVQKETVVLRQNEIALNFKELINSTKVGDFTPIFMNDGYYTTLYIKQKMDVVTVSYDDAKNQIFNVIMKEREDKLLKEYFDKVRITADIKVLR